MSLSSHKPLFLIHIPKQKRRNAEAAQPLQKKKKKSTKAAFIEVATVKSSYQAPQEVTTV